VAVKCHWSRKAEMLAIEGRFGHAGGFSVGGENLWAQTTGKDITDLYNDNDMDLLELEYVASLMRSTTPSWYSQVSLLNWDWDEKYFNDKAFALGAGHFTALMWKNTKLSRTWH